MENIILNSLSIRYTVVSHTIISGMQKVKRLKTNSNAYLIQPIQIEWFGQFYSKFSDWIWKLIETVVRENWLKKMQLERKAFKKSKWKHCFETINCGWIAEQATEPNVISIGIIE